MLRRRKLLLLAWLVLQSAVGAWGGPRADVCVCCAGCFDSFLNVQITLVLIAQVSICLAFAVGSYCWREHLGYLHPSRALDVYNRCAHPYA